MRALGLAVGVVVLGVAGVACKVPDEQLEGTKCDEGTNSCGDGALRCDLATHTCVLKLSLDGGTGGGATGGGTGGGATGGGTGGTSDAGTSDAGTSDAGATDGGATDGGSTDGGCIAATCAGKGYTCGTAPDGCGGTITCDGVLGCVWPETCGGSGTPNVCGAPVDAGCSTSKACPANSECGTIDDGCGHTVTCGAGCSSGKVCSTTLQCAALCDNPPPTSVKLAPSAAQTLLVGSFTGYDLGSTVRGVTAGDVDGDGRDEILAIVPGNNELRVLSSTGTALTNCRSILLPTGSSQVVGPHLSLVSEGLGKVLYYVLGTTLYRQALWFDGNGNLAAVETLTTQNNVPVSDVVSVDLGASGPQTFFASSAGLGSTAGPTPLDGAGISTRITGRLEPVGNATSAGNAGTHARDGFVMFAQNGGSTEADLVTEGTGTTPNVAPQGNWPLSGNLPPSHFFDSPKGTTPTSHGLGVFAFDSGALYHCVYTGGCLQVDPFTGYAWVGNVGAAGLSNVQASTTLGANFTATVAFVHAAQNVVVFTVADYASNGTFAHVRHDTLQSVAAFLTPLIAVTPADLGSSAASSAFGGAHDFVIATEGSPSLLVVH